MSFLRADRRCSGGCCQRGWEGTVGRHGWLVVLLVDPLPQSKGVTLLLLRDEPILQRMVVDFNELYGS